MTDERERDVPPGPDRTQPQEPEEGPGAENALESVLRGEHGPELELPPSIRTMINTNRRVIE